MRELVLLFQLGSSYPSDEHVEQAIISRIDRTWMSHGEICAAHRRLHHATPAELYRDIFRNTFYAVGRCIAPWRPRELLAAARSAMSTHRHGAATLDVLARRAILRTAVSHLADADVIIVGRSSGALIATQLASEGHRQIRGVIALGYPFRRPHTPPEPARLRHLAGLRVPTLILQGDRDPYGAVDAVAGYRLADSVTVEMVEADHEFRLAPPGWADIARRMTRFIDALER